MRYSSIGLFAALLICGCEAPVEKPIKVEGRVILDGIPLAGATVTFIPMTQEGHRAHGESGTEGMLLLTTFHDYDGILPGDYKVTVSLPESGKDKPTEANKTNGDRRPPTHDVLPGLELYHAPLPSIYSDEATTPLRQEIPPRGKTFVLDLSSRTPN
jgi:hypothetical protein